MITREAVQSLEVIIQPSTCRRPTLQLEKLTTGRTAMLELLAADTCLSAEGRTHSRCMSCKVSMHALQADLDNGESVKALRRFNRLLSNLTADTWGESQ